MTTVFAILTLVVVSGNVLIRIVDRYFPSPTSSPLPITKLPQSGELSPDIVAAIVATVEVVTHGKGNVTHIEQKEK